MERIKVSRRIATEGSLRGTGDNFLQKICVTFTLKKVV